MSYRHHDLGDFQDRPEETSVSVRPHDPDMLNLPAAAPAANRDGNAVIALTRVLLLIKSLLTGLKVRLGLLDLSFNLFK